METLFKVRFRVMFILIALGSIIPTTSAVSGRPPSDEFPESEKSSSKKRRAPHSDSEEELSSSKRSKIIEETNDSLIVIPAAPRAAITPNFVFCSNVLYHILPHLSSSDFSEKLMTIGHYVLRQKLNPFCVRNGQISMDWTIMNAVWKLWYKREKSSTPHSYEQALISWKELYYRVTELQKTFKTLDFSKAFHNLPRLFNKGSVIHSLLSKNIVPPFAELKELADQDDQVAQDYVAHMLYNEEHSKDTGLSREQRFNELEELAYKHDNKVAQDCLAHMLYDEVSNANREIQSFIDQPVTKLKKLAYEKDNKVAQDYLACIVYNEGISSVDDYETDTKRIKELQNLAKKGSKKAQNYLAKACYKKEIFNYELSGDCDAYLKDLAYIHGNKVAQYYLEIIDGDREEDEEESFEDIEDEVENSSLNSASDLFFRRTHRVTMTDQDRFEELQEFASQGCKEARQYVIEAIRDGALGQTKNDTLLKNLTKVNSLLDIFTGD